MGSMRAEKSRAKTHLENSLLCSPHTCSRLAKCLAKFCKVTAVSKTLSPAAALSNARLHDDGLLLTLLGEHQPEICDLTPHLQ